MEANQAAWRFQVVADKERVTFFLVMFTSLAKGLSQWRTSNSNI